MSQTLTGESDASGQKAVKPLRWLSQLRHPTPVSLVAYCLILAVVGWRTWAALQWSFQGDDWLVVSNADRMSFLRFVTMQYHGHLQPGQYVLVWLATRLSPLNYGLYVTPLLVFAALGGALMWRLLVDLFGERPSNLVPLAVFLLCPLTLPPALWVSAGMITVPLQAFIAGTLLAALHCVRAPSPRRLAAVGLVYLVAVLFSEKAVLIFPLTVLFVLLFLGEGRGRARLRSPSLGLLRMWAALGVVTVLYVSWYVSSAAWQLTERPGLSAIGHLVSTTLGTTAVPSYLGGPWAIASFRGVLYQLPGLARVLTWGAAGAIVVVSVVFFRQAWRAWILPVAYLGMCIGLVAAGRLSLIGSVIGLSSRYVADSVPVLALALALAYNTPLDRKGDPGWERRMDPARLAARFRAWTFESPEDRLRAVSPQAPSRSWALALALTAAYAVSAMITNVQVAGQAGTYSSKAWLATVRSEIAANPTASIVDNYLPPSVIQAALFPGAAKASHALAPIARRVRWDAAGSQLLIFDRSGHLHVADVTALDTARPGPVKGCGYLVHRGPVTAPLQRELFSWTWGIKLVYFTDKIGSGTVTVDSDRQRVSFQPGLHLITLVHHGAATEVTLETAGTIVCVGGIVVGDLVPVPAKGT
jgi:hypothetical protein